MLNLYHTNRIKTTMQNPQLISTNLYHNSSLSIKSQFLETHTPNHQWCLITFSRNSVCLNIKVTHNDTNYTKYLEFTNQLTFTCFVENLIHNFTMKMKPHCMLAYQICYIKASDKWTESMDWLMIRQPAIKHIHWLQLVQLHISWMLGGFGGHSCHMGGPFWTECGSRILEYGLCLW